MDMRDIKTDEESIFRLCNSLNAVKGALNCCGENRTADLLLTAQATITKLFMENQTLRREKEDAK